MVVLKVLNSNFLSSPICVALSVHLPSFKSRRASSLVESSVPTDHIGPGKEDMLRNKGLDEMRDGMRRRVVKRQRCIFTVPVWGHGFEL